ncbi:MAG: sensor histidine kinase [Chthoniobacterales bacterium]
MSNLDALWLLLLGGGLIFLGTLGWRFLLSLLLLRRVIERLAARDYRSVIFPQPFGFFRRTARNIAEISELLQRQDRQILDEGFSLRVILSSMNEGVMIVDAKQRIRLVNSALKEMWDMQRPPLDRGVMEVFLRPDLSAMISETLATAESRHTVLRLPASGKGAVMRVFGVYTSAFFSSPEAGGEVSGAVVVFHDSTREYHLEDVRKEFIANVSHEFRTPLSIINGYVETLLDGALEDREMAEESLRVMQRHGERLNVLIKDLLLLSRLENQAVEMELSEIDLQLVSERVVEQMGALIKEKNARVVLEFSKDYPKLRADEARFEQVLLNLLTNALHYGSNPADGSLKPKSLEIQIRGDSSDTEVFLSVADNGPGIPLDDQPHIFERFYRVNKARSRDVGGSGLGLSIVKNVVRAHGGRVALHSKAGEGAVFKIALPRHANKA